MKIGVLALQGAVQAHASVLEKLGIESVAVRRASDLSSLSGIILPGGESTTMIHLLKLNALWEPLKDFIETRPTWGVCAGSILLAKEVAHPAQVSFGVMDISVERNAFGRQNESFISALRPTQHWPQDEPLEGIFIRAPRIRKLGPSVRTLLEWHDESVMVEEAHLLASTFHPELTEQVSVHQYFIERCNNHGRAIS